MKPLDSRALALVALLVVAGMVGGLAVAHYELAQAQEVHAGKWMGAVRFGEIQSLYSLTYYAGCLMPTFPLNAQVNVTMTETNHTSEEELSVNAQFLVGNESVDEQLVAQSSGGALSLWVLGTGLPMSVCGYSYNPSDANFTGVWS